MLKKDGNNYRLVAAEQINKNLRNIKKFFMERIDGDKVLKRLDHQAYEKLEKKIKSLSTVKEIMTLEEILMFSQNNIIGSIEVIPRKILKLEIAGFSITHWSQPELTLNTNIILENTYAISYYMPAAKDYMICKPEKPDKKLDQFLAQKKLYNIIELFRYEHLAREIRAQIAVAPIRDKKYAFINLVQRFGLLPKGGFQRIKPAAADTVLYLGTGKPCFYYESTNILNTIGRYSGLSNQFKKSEVLPLEINSKKSAALYKMGTRGHIYETFDEIHYRQLVTPWPERLMRGPSHIANGYNIIFNKKLKKHTGAPIISAMSLNAMLDFDRRKYMDFKISSVQKRRDKIVDDFLGQIAVFLGSYPEMKSKLMQHELKLNLAAEKSKLNRKLREAATIEDFFEDIIADKNNFVLKFERKMKIFGKQPTR
jgi:hypothetical protein